MPFVRMMRMLSAMESGQLDGAALEALLQEPGRAGELQVLIADRSLRKRMFASGATTDAILGSATARALLMENTAAYSDMLAIENSRKKLMASSIAWTAFVSKPAGKMAVFNSSPTLSDVVLNAAALDILRNAPGSSTTTAVTSVAGGYQINGTVAGASYLWLGASSNSSSYSTTMSTYVRGTPNPVAIQNAGGSTGIGQPIAMALTGPLVSTTPLASNFYIRILRCDI